MTSSPILDQLTHEQLRALTAHLFMQVDAMGKKTPLEMQYKRVRAFRYIVIKTPQGLDTHLQ